jgi:basic membrane protein A and related proteins
MLLAGVGGGAAHARPVLRVGYVTLAGTVPTSRDLGGVPLIAFVRAVKQYRVQARVVYVAPNQDPAVSMESLARQKYDLIIVGLPNVTGVDSVAAKFPRVKFLLIDVPVELLPHRRANVRGTLYRAEQAAFLAGYLAVLMEHRVAGKHVVSSVGGLKVWGVDRWIVGFNAGAKKADSTVTSLSAYSQDFANPEKCRTIALSQFAKGSGAVFNVSGACGLGALDATKAHGVWGVGVDIDQSFLGKHILTSAVARLDKCVVDAIRALVEGTFTTGGNKVYDLRNGGVGLGKISPSVPPSVIRQLTEIRRQIVAGKIDVPSVSRT